MFISVRYVGQISGYVREIMTHKNYKEIDEVNGVPASQSQPQNSQGESGASGPPTAKPENIERALLEERDKNKAKIPYMFTCCTDMPGKFLLSYLIKVRPVIFACSNYLQTDQCFYVCNIKFSSNYYIL